LVIRFIEGEGSIYVQKHNNNLYFSISQSAIQIEVMEAIKSFLLFLPRNNIVSNSTSFTITLYNIKATNNSKSLIIIKIGNSVFYEMF